MKIRVIILICYVIIAMKHNNNSSKVKSLKFGASINRYDIINDLGESNIRNTIKTEYEEWLSTGSCG